jgi:putative transposase
MEQKHRFISLAGTGRFTLTELCADFQISRKTGYKWLRRYQAEGLRGLQTAAAGRMAARITPPRSSSG